MHAITMCGFDPECDRSMSEDIDIYDFIPLSSSPFSRLLEEKENMKAWNNFLSKSEEEQRSFLKSVHGSEDEEEDDACCDQRKNRTRRMHAKAMQEKEDKHNNKKTATTVTLEPEEEKVQHPAFSPELSFDRIDARIKRIFRKSRRIPIVSSLTFLSLSHELLTATQDERTM